MNDLERQVRDTLRRHEQDAPSFDAADARRTAGRTRRRQILNVAGVGVCTLVVAVGLVAGLGGLMRADQPPFLPATPPPSPTSVAPPTPESRVVHGWPGARVAPAGVYSWDPRVLDWMHNVSGGASGIEIEFIPEGAHASNLWPAAEIPTGDPTAATIAGYHAAYWNLGAGREEWAIDIDGTKFSIRLLAHPGTTEDELAAAHAVIESIAKEPQEQEPGFMLTFTLPHGWDSG